MADYQSIFTGSELDGRLSAVSELQAALVQLEAALAAKYSKPAAGIPATDLDAAVNAALAKANTAVQSLADYYTKPQVDAMVAAINSEEYVTVATLPTASASTIGKIYLVGPTNDEYDRYITTASGGSYSWLQIGTTAISLADYATAEEFDELDARVDMIEPRILQWEHIDPLDYSLRNYVINTSTGKYGTSTNYKHVAIHVQAGDIVDVTGNAEGTSAYAFLTSNATPVAGAAAPLLNGVLPVYIAANTTVRLTVPEGAHYLYIYLGATSTNYPNKPADMEKAVFIIEDRIRDIHPYESLELSAFDWLRGLITGSNKWSSTNAHFHVQIPVTPGQRFKIIGNAANYSSYAFFTQAATWSNGGTPPFVPGTERVVVQSGEVAYITIPSGCAYLYVVCWTSTDKLDLTPELLARLVHPDTVETVDKAVAESSGTPHNYFDYETDEFFTNNSVQMTVAKDDNGGYRVDNIASAGGVYALYTLPSDLIVGQSYVLEMEYENHLTSAPWAFTAVRQSDRSIVIATVLRLPVSGRGKIRAIYTHTSGAGYFRLASSSENAGDYVILRNLSLTHLADLSTLDARLTDLENTVGAAPGATIPYAGEKIVISRPEHKYGYEVYMSNLPSHQSSALYGDYLIVFTKQMTNIYLYNLATKSLLASLAHEQLDELHHCNQAFFGTEKYAESDAFPLVYVSVRNDGTLVGGKIEAYRVIPADPEHTGEYTEFSIELVQTITLPVMTRENALGNPNAVLDPDTGYLYTYSRNNTSSDPNYNLCRITKWQMPTLADGNVTLTDEDILDSFETEVSALNMQGGVISNGTLFVFRGYSTVGYIDLFAFSLAEKRMATHIDLMDSGFLMEPEGAIIYGGELYTTSLSIYRFIF